jgi:hypothetical protein
MEKLTKEQSKQINVACLVAVGTGNIREAINALPYGLHCRHFMAVCDFLQELVGTTKKLSA